MNDIRNLKPNTIITDNFERDLYLASWLEFQSRRSFYASKDSDKFSNGLVKVFVVAKKANGAKITTIEQVNAINYLINNSDRIRDKILAGLLNQLPELKGIYEGLISEINKVEDFKNFIGLANLHLMAADKENFAYIGFEFGCEWDEEHGLGVMMHKDRVVAIGQADTAFDSWITFDDNGTAAIEIKKLEAAKQTKNKKSWWRFWE